MNSTPRVFIVDDCSDVRDSLASLVSEHGLDTESYSSGTEFLSVYDGQTAGCLIIDIRLPGLNGLEVLDVLAERGIRLPTIVVTGHGEVPLVVRAVRSGAIDFLEKPFKWDQLKGSIDLALKLDAMNRKIARQLSAIDERLALLTPQEHRVMEMLVAGRPNKTIAAESDISLRTVEFRRARVLQVFDARCVSEVVAVKIIRGRLLEQTNRPFNEWIDGMDNATTAACDFDLCPSWIHRSSTAAMPVVAPDVEAGIALNIV
jgi:FixJ family two-component response regulator